MNVNQVVCIRSNGFAEIKTGATIGEHRPMRLRLRISSAHYRRTRQPGYRLRVARQFHML